MSKTKASDRQGLVPKLRFPEFRDADAWETRQLDTVYEFKPTNSLSRDALNYDNGGIKNIHYGDIHKKFSTLFDITKERVPFINDGEACEAVKSASYCKEGDMVFADASEDMDDIGKSIEIINLNHERVVSGQHTLLARQKQGLLVTGFAGYLFKSNYARLGIRREAQGAKVLGISPNRLARVGLMFPSSSDEQQKIADCLSSLDALIAAHTDKLAALKTHKKGLLQQLFPPDGETVPRLRFPEFRNAGAWAMVECGRSFAQRSEPGKDGLPIYSVTMSDGMVKRSSMERRVVDIDKPEGNRRVCKGDIAYNMMRMWQGACGVAPEDCMVSPAYVVLDPRLNVFSEFFGFLLKLPATLLQLESHSQGLTKDRLRLYYKDFATIELLCPTYSEQQKIADCLSGLDTLITAQTDKIEALKQHKQGLLQQLFPAMDEVAT